MEPMIIDGFVHQLPDVDPEETQEWLDSLSAVVDAQGKTRARFLMSKLLERGDVTFRWVKGHGVDPMNDLVDRLAVEASLTQMGRRGGDQRPLRRRSSM